MIPALINFILFLGERGVRMYLSLAGNPREDEISLYDNSPYQAVFWLRNICKFNSSLNFSYYICLCGRDEVCHLGRKSFLLYS